MKKKNIKRLISKYKKYKKRMAKLEARLEVIEKSCCPPEKAADSKEVEVEVEVEVDAAESGTSQAESTS